MDFIKIFSAYGIIILVKEIAICYNFLVVSPVVRAKEKGGY